LTALRQPATLNHTESTRCGGCSGAPGAGIEAGAVIVHGVTVGGKALVRLSIVTCRAGVTSAVCLPSYAATPAMTDGW